MHLKTTRLSKNIITDFLPPKNLHKNNKSNKVIIFLDGMPSLPGGKKRIAKFFSNKNYWFFNFRYRGSWESGGEFLKHEPTQDVLDVINSLEKSFTSIWDNKKYKINKPEFYLIGSSFGGPAALLSSQNKKIKKIITISGVVDWNDKDSEEPLDKLYTIITQAFGEGYRLSKTNFNKLGKTDFYNPVAKKNIKKIDTNKVLMIHAKDDKIVSYHLVKNFAKNNNIKLLSLKQGGHLSSKILTKYFIWRKIKKFLNK